MRSPDTTPPPLPLSPPPDPRKAGDRLRGRRPSIPPARTGEATPPRGLWPPGPSATGPMRRAPPNRHPPAPTVTSTGLQSYASTHGQPMDRFRAEAHRQEPGQYGDHTLHGPGDAEEARFRARPREAEGRTEAERPFASAPPGPPNRAPEGGRHKDRPPAPPPTRRRTAPDAQARARRDTRPRARRGEKGTGLPPPSEVARRRTGLGHETGGARTAWNGPTGALHRNHARCARHTDPGRGEGRGRRGSASAHTRKGQAGRTRGGIGPSPRNAQTPWNGVPAGEDKGHPDKMTRHTHTAGNAGEEGGARGEKRERAPAPTPQNCRERRAHTTRALQPPRQ